MKNKRLLTPSGAMPLTIVKESQHVVPQVLEGLRAEQADVILYDPMCLWARIVAQVLHVPAILLRPTFAANEHFQVMPPLDMRDFFTHSEVLNVVFLPRAFQPAGETFDERFVSLVPPFSDASMRRRFCSRCRPAEFPALSFRSTV